MDATRRSDGRSVALKLVPVDTEELPVWSFLTSGELEHDPRNRCVPLLDVHPLPDTDEQALAVMPLLVQFDLIYFETPGELLLCLYQLSEVSLRLCRWQG